jgi:predicted Zn-dependent peptidase
VLRKLLAGESFSCLNRLLRDGAGILYILEANTEYTHDSGYLHIQLAVPSNHLRQAKKIVLSVFENAKALFSRDDLSMAKKRQRYSICLD